MEKLIKQKRWPISDKTLYSRWGKLKRLWRMRFTNDEVEHKVAMRTTLAFDKENAETFKNMMLFAVTNEARKYFMKYERLPHFIDVYFKQPGYSGVPDPVNQYGSVGWKWKTYTLPVKLSHELILGQYILAEELVQKEIKDKIAALMVHFKDA